MTIKEIRKITGLSQADFGKCYDIPLPTIKKWEASSDNQNHRECPVYVNHLLERVVKIDFMKGGDRYDTMEQKQKMDV